MALVLISPALPVIALFTTVLVAAEPAKKTPGLEPNAIVPPVKVPVPDACRFMPEVMPSVWPAPIVVVKVPVRLSALMLTELATVDAAVTATFVPGVLKSVA